MRSWIRQVLTVYQEKETCNSINVRHEHVAARVVEDINTRCEQPCLQPCQLRPTGCLLKYQSGTDLVQSVYGMRTALRRMWGFHLIAEGFLLQGRGKWP